MGASARSPESSPALSGGRLGLILPWVAENTSAWPLLFLAFLGWRPDQLLWALVQRLDSPTNGIGAPRAGRPPTRRWESDKHSGSTSM